MFAPLSATAQQPQLKLGAQAIGLLTHATPAVAGESLTEKYLTQPNIFLHGSAGRFTLTGALNFEGWTLKDGELNAGTWGEGYYDKRHPHTYVHEAVLTFAGRLRGFDLSLSAGKGFAGFGSDDPMVRPLVKFPANHHLAQLLERLVLVGAVRRGPILVEGSTFNGDEPLNASSLGHLDNFADSWAARVTLLPGAGYELQGSYAFVNSPEQHEGKGWDQKKLSFSVRRERNAGSWPHYLLLEWLRTGEYNDAGKIVDLHSVLGEGSVERGRWRASGRIERTVRPEDERAGNIFRSPWPHVDEKIWGLTRWVIVSSSVSRSFELKRVRFAPLVEVGRQWAWPASEIALFDPNDLYGSDQLWSLSFGLRFGAGMRHARMGRYGVALPTSHDHH